MVGHGGSSAGSYLADPTSPIPSHKIWNHQHLCHKAEYDDFPWVINSAYYAVNLHTGAITGQMTDAVCMGHVCNVQHYIIITR